MQVGRWWTEYLNLWSKAAERWQIAQATLVKRLTVEDDTNVFHCGKDTLEGTQMSPWAAGGVFDEDVVAIGAAFVLDNS